MGQERSFLDDDQRTLTVPKANTWVSTRLEGLWYGGIVRIYGHTRRRPDGSAPPPVQLVEFSGELSEHRFLLPLDGDALKFVALSVRGFRNPARPGTPKLFMVPSASLPEDPTLPIEWGEPLVLSPSSSDPSFAQVRIGLALAEPQ
ncbi:MAG: hypothetical protein H6722_26350 [Sandaracinus sp.]|nr:hypothetical protein [Sandaracinus sp.]MCB9621866.1 hypothetical protein [Sandaracinus sp.]